MIVRWYHAIFSAYGFWLPNDPRGRWSTFVGAYELYRAAGDATKTGEKRSLARAAHDRQTRLATKSLLMYPPVRFDDAQRTCIAGGIEQACAESDIKLFALAIGHDHIHVAVGQHAKSIEQIVQHFKSRASKRLRAADCHPLRAFQRSDGSLPSPFSNGCWSVFIKDPPQLRSVINYIQRHPLKEGLPPQRWRFLTDARREFE